ncbi:MFS transporter [Selenomonadales bacterium OttesenSCG-928-I06]|nr:MFS transporter [Selenomonadales bacterium OttesenSCG-928-I06]
MHKKYMSFLAASHLTNDLTVGALPAILPFLISIYGIDYQAATGLMFAYALMSSFIQPIFGYIADRTSFTWFMSLGIFINCLGMSFIGFSEHYWAIFASFMVCGVGSAIYHPEAARLVNRLSGKKKGSGIGIFSVGGNSGFALGPVLSVAMILAFGMKGLFIFTIIGSAMAIFLIWQVPKIKETIATADQVGVAAEKTEIKVLENDWKGFSKLTIIIIGRSIIFSGLMAFIPLYWINVLMQSNATGASALTILFAFGVVVTLIGGLLSDKLGYRKTMMIFCSLVAPLVFILINTNNLILATLLLIPLGFSVFAPFSAMIVLGQTYLGKSVGFASGVTMGLAFSVGGMVLPLLGGVADNYGLQQAMEVIVYVAIVTAIFTFFLPKPKNV